MCQQDRAILSGGEPTAHPRLLEILELTGQYGFGNICLYTNGARLRNRGFVDELAERGVKGAMISLHGSCADVHDRLVGKAQFERVVRGIGNALSVGIGVTINTVVTTANLGDIGAISRLVQEGFSAAHFHRISYPALLGDILKRSELVPRYDDVVAAVLSLAEAPVRLCCDLIPFCLLGSRAEIAIGGSTSLAPDLTFNGTRSRYRRVAAKPCLDCRFRFHCHGLQHHAVLRHGVPAGYGMEL